MVRLYDVFCYYYTYAVHIQLCRGMHIINELPTGATSTSFLRHTIRVVHGVRGLRLVSYWHIIFTPTPYTPQHRIGMEAECTFPLGKYTEEK